MTTLEKLGILGIRSFSPESLEVLAFEKPLTLIVGHNGAGKTTVVECLKMATTGELPPSAGKGQNFIHNSKTTDVPETKGQIRLVFRAANDKKILANRSFQLSTTRDRKGQIKTAFKALEAVLQVKDADGTVRSINQKCAQLDQQVPQLMGVSRAILENVVFCHQEESNWPLGEMTKLKKKFDDLFGATRYSKALDTINVLRKERQKIGKEKQHELELLQTNLEQAKLLKTKMEQAKRKDAVLNEELKTLLCAQTQEQKTLDTKKKQLELLRENEIQLKITNQALETCKTEIGRLRDAIPQDSDFKNLDLSQVQDYSSELTATLQGEKVKLDTLRHDITELEMQFNDLSARKEQMEHKAAESIRYEERVRSLQQTAADIRNQLSQSSSLSSTGGPSWSTLPDDKLILTLTDLKQDKNTELTEVQKRFHQTRTTTLSELHKTREELLTLTAEEARLQSTIEALKRRLKDAERIICQEADVRASLQAVTQNLQKAREASSADSGSDTLTLDQKLNELRDTRKQLREKLILSSNAQTSLPAHLDTPEASTSLQSPDHIIIASLYKQCFNQTLKSQTVESVQAEVAKQLERLEKLREEKHEKQLLHAEAQGKLFMIRSRRQCLEHQRTTLLKTLKPSENVALNWGTALKAQREQVEVCLKQLTVAQSAEKLYKNHLQRSIDKNSCAFCTRAFDTNGQLDVLQTRMQSRLTLLSQAIEQQKESLDTERLQLQTLENVQETALTLRFIDSTLNQLLETELCLKKAMAQYDADSAQACTTWLAERPSYALVSRLHGYLLAAQERGSVDVLGKEKSSERQQKNGHPALVTSALSLQELHSQLKSLEQAIESAELNLETKRDELNAQKCQIASLESRKASLEEREACITEALQHQQDDLDNLNEHEKNSKDVSSKIIRIKAQCQSLQEDVELHDQQAQIATGRLQADIDLIGSALDGLNTVKCETTEAEAVLGGLRIAAKTVKKLATELKNVTLELQRKRTESASTQETLKRLESQSAALELLNRLRLKESELLKMQQDIAVFEQVCFGEEADPTKLRAAIDTLSSTTQALAAKIGSLNGEQKSNREWQRQHETELCSNKYKDIDNRYRFAMVEAETECMAIRDLQKYHAALDKALMKYHTVKMQSINKTLRELWQAIYKGRDIDYIIIRSDTDEELQYVTTGQRSYNYRVMMVKDGGFELEMRGRCSAGQKVLASIVIRLALAESFGINCGILALDEPTTNLDRNNMDGLARALADLIASRRHCANFQLVLITHDEEFVRMLARHQPCDSFFQVSKNKEGYSIIRRADIRNF